MERCWENNQLHQTEPERNWIETESKKKQLYIQNAKMTHKKTSFKNQWGIQIKNNLNLPLLGTFVGNGAATNKWLQGKLNDFILFIDKVLRIRSQSKRNGQYSDILFANS